MARGEDRERHLREALLGWYAEQGRDLPWRRTSDPYAVLVSETMLQQTQVARVIPRFERWLERWPGASALAAASGEEVLAEWSGLGYNRRALRLRDAARVVAASGWPSDEAGLRALPGVGAYTAAAVAAFAFGLPAAAVDVNQQRVLDRWDAAARPPGELRTRALALVPPEHAAEWNHALMDLGATICTARVARCDACPVADACRSAGLVDPVAERALRPAGSGEKQQIAFEATQRYVRGRIVAALVEHGSQLPGALASRLPAGISEARIDDALTSLLADGTVTVDEDGGRVRLAA